MSTETSFEYEQYLHVHVLISASVENADPDK